ncbi:hypothetical protein FA13DRAFT_1717430 [Coprinellus micaceus]|uniref:Uncharacterized protein n=1 Tax=Coprinellus micaceus TaxID=71717 RepID=A0A4Y7SGT0_COPMI|nr:hypothetical protein FA13DRAFT_1717430 [Coprinellus micaceus]
MESRRSSKRPASQVAITLISALFPVKRRQVNAPLADSPVVNINTFVVADAPTHLFTSTSGQSDADKENSGTALPEEKEDDWVTEETKPVVDPQPPRALRRSTRIEKLKAPKRDARLSRRRRSLLPVLCLLASFARFRSPRASLAPSRFAVVRKWACRMAKALGA